MGRVAAEDLTIFLDSLYVKRTPVGRLGDLNMSSQSQLFGEIRRLVDIIRLPHTPSETRAEAIAELTDTYITLESEHNITDTNRNNVVADLMKVFRLALSSSSSDEVRLAGKQAISDLENEDLFGVAIDILGATDSEELVRTAFESNSRKRKLAAAAAVRESGNDQLFGVALRNLPEDALVHLFDRAATEHAHSMTALSDKVKSYNKDVFKGQMIALEARRREDEARRRAAAAKHLELSKVVNNILRL